MDYTYQEKCVAAIECKLWWRFPDSVHECDREWARVTDDVTNVVASDLSKTNAEYHIGDEPPKPPRVLSELERELLEALESMVGMHEEGATLHGLVGPTIDLARAAIAKAKGEA